MYGYKPGSKMLFGAKNIGNPKQQLYSKIENERYYLWY